MIKNVSKARKNVFNSLLPENPSQKIEEPQGFKNPSWNSMCQFIVNGIVCVCVQ